LTIAEKILAKRAGKKAVRPGQIIECSVDLAFAHDATCRILKPFFRMGGAKVWDSERLIMLLDHLVPADSETTAQNHKNVREFAFDQELKYFYDVKEGICHQVLPEKGHVMPGMFIVGSDSHTTTHGAFGSFATGLGDTDMAAVFLDGQTWLRVPETVQIVLLGSPPEDIVGKDIILYLLGKLGAAFANYRCIEFAGSALKNINMESRMTICNMCMEMGAKAAIFPPDEITFTYLEKTTTSSYETFFSDSPDDFCERLEFDVSRLKPQMAAPHSPANVSEVSRFSGIKVNQVYLGSCTNGRLEDLNSAYRILKGKTIAKTVRMYISPASREIYLTALKLGYLTAFAEAGAVILNPTCGACLGGQMGLLAANEVCVSTCNRNYPGRMGSAEGRIYLSSPATAAATAIAGVIATAEELK
jgi:3-isopropylmalate/(R)-2-methylmalate dehydratase large subunit